MGDVKRARAFFDGMPTKDVVSRNSMIDGYAKVGEVEPAREIFDKMLQKNVISWSIMIDGYVRHGDSKEALNLFRQMLCQGIKPDRVSVVGAVSACSQLGALDQGRWIHLYVKRNRLLLDIVVQTALVDMYLKCGSLDEACRIFNCMPERNVVTWSVMIVGLGMNGYGKEALECFARMEKERIPMDDMTFLGVLMACSHANLVTEGLRIFNRMRDAYRLEPKLEHYGCLVDLLGRAGQLDEAQNIIQSMPMKPNAVLWGSLLLACRIHRNVDLAEILVEKLAELKADDSGVYVLMSNIYADVGIWEGMIKIRKLVKERKMKKETGRSVIEVDGNVEEFISGERSHTLREEIELVIWSLAKMSILAG